MQVQVSKAEMKDEERPKASAPIAKFSAGGITAAIWENDGKEGASYNTVTMDKRYKSGDEWKSTKSMRLNDLPKAVLVLQKAYEFLALKGADV